MKRALAAAGITEAILLTVVLLAGDVGNAGGIPIPNTIVYIYLCNSLAQ